MPIAFSCDVLSMTMVSLAIFMTICSALFKGEVLSTRSIPLWSFCAFACLASTASNWLVFTVFLELSSIALSFSVGEKDRATARFYLYSQLAGGSILLVGTAMISSSGIVAPIGPVSARALPVFLLGLGVKVGFPGFHFWLPKTHSQAPTEASVLLSGYSVKMAIYGLLRLIDFPFPELIFVGTAMALYGVLQALLQHDGKRLLSYHTMSQLGFMVAALGSGSELGRSAALFHLVAHGLFKGLLFMSAGSLEKAYGTRDLGLLGRGARDLPWVFLFFLLGATAIAGVPGTSGYASKILIKTALYPYPKAVWALNIAGLGTVLSFCKFCYYGFIRPARPAMPEIRPKATLGFHHLLAMASMGMVTVLLVLFPSAMPLFPEAIGSLWSVKSLTGAAVTLIVGIGLFSLLPNIFSPKEGHVPDVEDIVPTVARFLFWLLVALRRFHSGKLRFYIALLVACLLFVFESLGR